MMMTWDENKRQLNQQKHGIDFADCESIFDHAMINKEDKRFNYGEQRLQSLGILNGQVVFIVWVDREESVHLLSARYAEKHERTLYYANTYF